MVRSATQFPMVLPWFNHDFFFFFFFLQVRFLTSLFFFSFFVRFLTPKSHRGKHCFCTNLTKMKCPSGGNSACVRPGVPGGAVALPTFFCSYKHFWFVVTPPCLVSNRSNMTSYTPTPFPCVQNQEKMPMCQVHKICEGNLVSLRDERKKIVFCPPLCFLLFTLSYPEVRFYC